MKRRTFLSVAGCAALGLGLAKTEALASYLPDKRTIKLDDHALSAKRWGMVVDTRKFHGPEDFKPLMDACHAWHNVPTIPGKQDLKWIWFDKFEAVFPQTLDQFQAHKVEEKPYLLLCNHCQEPPCIRVCPTQATFKREDGIVVMDMHRCIGCRFCMAACPFGARSFNFMDPRTKLDPKKINPEYPTRMKGVVEKCNFCMELLAEGKQPACVTAAAGKLVFGDLEDPHSEIRKVLAENYTIRRKPELGTHPSVFYII